MKKEKSKKNNFQKEKRWRKTFFLSPTSLSFSFFEQKDSSLPYMRYREERRFFHNLFRFSQDGIIVDYTLFFHLFRKYFSFLLERFHSFELRNEIQGSDDIPFFISHPFSQVQQFQILLTENEFKEFLSKKNDFLLSFLNERKKNFFFFDTVILSYHINGHSVSQNSFLSSRKGERKIKLLAFFIERKMFDLIQEEFQRFFPTRKMYLVSIQKDMLSIIENILAKQSYLFFYISDISTFLTFFDKRSEYRFSQILKGERYLIQTLQEENSLYAESFLERGIPVHFRKEYQEKFLSLGEEQSFSFFKRIFRILPDLLKEKKFREDVIIFTRNPFFENFLVNFLKKTGLFSDFLGKDVNPHSFRSLLKKGREKKIREYIGSKDLELFIPFLKTEYEKEENK